VQGEVGDHGDFVLTSADGTAFGAYHAHPAEGSSRAVVILPDVRGLHSFYKELALRFAEAGFHAVAFDYFGRTAGIGERDEGFEYRPHVEATTPQTVTADVAACGAWLRERTGARTLFTVGFCFGGSMSWGQSALGEGFAGCIGFYGNPARVTDLVPRMRVPLLLLAAGEDFTPVETVAQFADSVRAVGTEAEMTVFEGMPHSFFDRTYADHAPQCAQAWDVMLSFMDRHTPA